MDNQYLLAILAVVCVCLVPEGSATYQEADLAEWIPTTPANQAHQCPKSTCKQPTDYKTNTGDYKVDTTAANTVTLAACKHAKIKLNIWKCDKSIRLDLHMDVTPFHKVVEHSLKQCKIDMKKGESEWCHSALTQVGSKQMMVQSLVDFTSCEKSNGYRCSYSEHPDKCADKRCWCDENGCNDPYTACVLEYSAAVTEYYSSELLKLSSGTLAAHQAPRDSGSKKEVPSSGQADAANQTMAADGSGMKQKTGGGKLDQSSSSDLGETNMSDAGADAWVKKLVGKDLERIFSATDLGQGAHFGRAKKAAKKAANAAKKAAKAAAKALAGRMLKAVIKKVKGIIAKFSSRLTQLVEKAVKLPLSQFCKGESGKLFDKKLVKSATEMAACTKSFTVDGLGSQDWEKFNRGVQQMKAELVRRMLAKLLGNWVTVPLQTLSKYMAMMQFPKHICKSMPPTIHQAVVKAISFIWLQIDRLPVCGMHFYNAGGRRRTRQSAWKSRGKGGLQEYRRRDTLGAGCKKCKYPTEGPKVKHKLVLGGNPKEGGPMNWKDFYFPPKSSKLFKDFDTYNETSP